MAEIVAALVGLARKVVQHDGVRAQHQELLERHVAAVARRRAGRRLEAGLGEQRRCETCFAGRITAAVDQQRGLKRRLRRGMQACARCIEFGEQFLAALRMPEHGSDFDDLAARGVEIGDQCDLVESQPLRAQDVLGHRPIVLADQHEIGLQRDGRFGLPV